MNFNLTEDQQMLVDSLDRFVTNDYPLSRRRQLAASPLGYDEANWSLFADMGLLGLTVPEAHGGMGMGAPDSFLVLRSLGRALLLEPLIPTSVVGASLIARAAAAAGQAQWLPAIAAGQLKVALAVDELQSHYDLDDVKTTLLNGRLNGQKSVVWHGASADRLIVAARNGDGTDAGLTLVCIDAHSAGVQIHNHHTLDGQRCAEINFDNVAVADADLLVHGPDGTDGAALLDWALDRGRAALCAESVGVAERLHQLLLDYMKTRVQFKQPLANFQVLQHRAVDMLVYVEQMHSSALLAAAHVDAEPLLRRRMVSAAKVQVGKLGRLLGELATQTFGGMGMTEEFDGGQYYKRLLTIDLTWGDSAYHMQRYIEQGL